MHHNPTAASIIAAGPVKVLDLGHVALVDVMGSDSSIASDARASLGNEGKTYTPEQDRGLIRRLMRDVHTSPFEMPEIKFHVKVPIYVWRQMERHRTASINERSGRYSELACEFHRTEADAWRLQDQENKQGSSGTLPIRADRHKDDSCYQGGDPHTSLENQGLIFAEDAYGLRLRIGIAREQARKDLPMSLYTEMVWKCDLHNLLHFLRLRLAPDAQLEIRQYAQAMASMVERLFPVTWEAFVDYRLESMTLSLIDLNVIRELLDNGHIASFDGVADHLQVGKRERAECRAKLVRLGLVAEEGGEK